MSRVPFIMSSSGESNEGRSLETKRTMKTFKDVRMLLREFNRVNQAQQRRLGRITLRNAETDGQEASPVSMRSTRIQPATGHNFSEDSAKAQFWFKKINP